MLNKDIRAANKRLKALERRLDHLEEQLGLVRIVADAAIKEVRALKKKPKISKRGK